MLKQSLAMLLVLALLAGGVVFAQDSTPATNESEAVDEGMPTGVDMSKPEAEPISNVIPASCSGFLVAGNLNKMMLNVEKFIGGMGMQDVMENYGGASLLPMAAMMLGLGEGFNPNGGFGVVMFDMPEPAAAETKPVETEDGKISLGNPAEKANNIVFLVAGKDAQKVFAMAVFSDDGKTFDLMGFSNLYFKQVGDYVAFSMSEDALKMMESPKKVSLKPNQLEVIKNSDLTLYTNPETVVKKLKGAVADSSPFGFDFGMSKKDLESMEGMIIGIDLRKEGMIINVVIDYKPDSDDAKTITKVATLPPVSLDRLPDCQYYLAAGIAGLDALMEQGDQLKESIDELVKELDIPDDIMDRINKLLEQTEGNVKQMQIVVGKTEKAPLVIGGHIACENADALMQMAPQKVEILNDLVEVLVANAQNPEKMKGLRSRIAASCPTSCPTTKASGKSSSMNPMANMKASLDEEDIAKIQKLKDLKFELQKGAATVDGVTFDAFVVDLTKSESITDEDRQKIVEIIGEETVRVLYGKIDDKAIVFAFGGGEDFLKSLIAAAKGGKSLATNPAIAAGVKLLGEKRMSVAAISPKNIFDALEKMTKDDDDDDDDVKILPFDGAINFSCTDPIIMGDTITGPATVTGKVFIPIGLWKDIFAILQQNMGGQNLPFQMPGMGGF